MKIQPISHSDPDLVKDKLNSILEGIRNNVDFETVNTDEYWHKYKHENEVYLINHTKVYMYLFAHARYLEGLITKDEHDKLFEIANQ